MLKIPPEWLEKSDLVGKDEATLRVMLVAVDSPEITAMRAKVSSLRTSELLTVFSQPLALFERHIGPDCFDAFTDDEGSLVCAACVLAVTDEIDRRIPQ
jgi:hypothetical protein